MCLLSLLNKIKMNWFSEVENKLIKFVGESIWELLKMVARLFVEKKILVIKKWQQNLRVLLNLFAKKFYGCKVLVNSFCEDSNWLQKGLDFCEASYCIHQYIGCKYIIFSRKIIICSQNYLFTRIIFSSKNPCLVYCFNLNWKHCHI